MERKPNKAASPAVKKKALDLWCTGTMSVSEVAQSVGFRNETVRGWIKKAGLWDKLKEPNFLPDMLFDPSRPHLTSTTQEDMEVVRDIVSAIPVDAPDATLRTTLVTKLALALVRSDIPVAKNVQDFKTLVTLVRELIGTAGENPDAVGSTRKPSGKKPSAMGLDLDVLGLRPGG
jgi:transposase-like protein